MNQTPCIQLLSLANGERLLRIEDETTGLSLERKLNPALPVLAQKTKLLRLFAELMSGELTAA
jgi:hypothetical protein